MQSDCKIYTHTKKEVLGDFSLTRCMEDGDCFNVCLAIAAIIKGVNLGLNYFKDDRKNFRLESCCNNFIYFQVIQIEMELTDKKSCGCLIMSYNYNLRNLKLKTNSDIIEKSKKKDYLLKSCL